MRICFSHYGISCSKGGPPEISQNLANMFRREVGEKDLLIHMFGGPGAEFIWQQGWNGAIPQVDHDYLMFVDSSLPGHAVKQIDRSWEYIVSLEVEQPSKASVRIQYDNHNESFEGVCRQASGDLMGCFPNYLRVLLSSKANDIQAPPVLLHEGTEKLAWGYTDLDTLTVSPRPARGIMEIGGYLMVEPATTVSFPIIYKLDPSVLRSTAPGVYEYRLLMQKQPGTNDNYTVAVQIPDGAELTETRPYASHREGRWVVFEGVLDEDKFIIVSFESG